MWISIENKLSPLFENVIVFGLIKERNVCPQVWQARRWSGSYPNPETNWIWLTPTDEMITDVRYWMPFYPLPSRK